MFRDGSRGAGFVLPGSYYALEAGNNLQPDGGGKLLETRQMELRYCGLVLTNFL
jgi:hypothetical protein